MSESGAGETGVLIVGAGPVGLTLAYELARRDVPFRLVEKRAERTQTSNALGIHARTLETFAIMGIADRFVAAGHPTHEVHLHAGGKLAAQISFADLDSPYPYILMLWQSETERLLEEALRERGGTVERTVELTALAQDEESVRATLRHADGTEETVACRYLVGTDGAHSTVRHLLNLSFEGAEYPETFVLGDIALSPTPSEGAMHLHIGHGDGIMGLFPYGGGRWRLIADQPPPDMSSPPSLADLQRIFDERGPSGITVSEPRWTSAFRIHRRIVSDLRTGRVFVAGDAAHIHSPAGGQGMNTGIQDVFNLGWKLALAVDGKAAPNLLDTYAEERRPVEEEVLRETDLMTRLATVHGPIPAALRNHLLPLVAGTGLVQRRLRDSLAEIAVEYRHSSLSEDHPVGHGGPRAGDRAPDAVLSDKASDTIYRRLNSGKPLLLLFEPVTGGNQPIPVSGVAFDTARIPVTDGQQYGVGSDGAAFFIRPDGYIGFRAEMDAGLSERIAAYCARLYG